MQRIAKFLYRLFLPLITLWLPTKGQRNEAADMFSRWLEKLSVVCFATGMFQPQNARLGLSVGVLCLLFAISIKTRRKDQ